MGRRVSANFLLSAVIDGENVQLYRIVSDHDSLSVDANNVSDRVECRIELQDGATSVPVTAYWSVEVKAREEVLDTYEFSDSRQSIDYALPNGPFDQYGKFGRATHLIVIAYKDATRNTELARKAYPLNRAQPQYFPRTEPWSSTLIYRNGEYLLCSSYEEVDGILLAGDDAVYVWSNPVPGNSAVSPGEDVIKNPRSTCWQKHSKWPVLMTEAFFANFAKLGSAVFSGDYMFSQHGKDKNGMPTTDYRNFGKTEKHQMTDKTTGKPMYDETTGEPIYEEISLFTPNFMVDWLKGKVNAMDGHIGGFKINGYNLSNADNRDCWISIQKERGTVKRLSSLGNNVPPSTGVSTAGYFEASGPNPLANNAITLRASGSTLSENINGMYANYCINAFGGVRWKMSKDDSWCMPGVLFAGHFGGGGETYEVWGDGANMQRLIRASTGTYQVTHGIGHMSYFVAITPMRNWTFATLQHKDVNSFSFTIADANRGLIDSEFDVMIFGRPFDK